MQGIKSTTGVKDKYKVSNWKEYDKSLCKRGSLTLWISEEVLAQWEQVAVSKKVVGKTDTIPKSV